MSMPAMPRSTSPTPESKSSAFSSLLKPAQERQLKDWVAQARRGQATFEMLFRASRDGFSASNFHEKCDRRGPTVVLARSTCGHLFGGYTEQEWDSTTGWKKCLDAFLFRLEPLPSKHAVIRIDNNTKTGILCDPDHGVTFGGEMIWWKKDWLKHDMDLLKRGMERWAKFCLGVAFERAGVPPGGCLADKNFAAVTEIEVFAVNGSRSLGGSRNTCVSVLTIQRRWKV